MVTSAKVHKTGTETNAVRTYRKKRYGRRKKSAVLGGVRKVSRSVCQVGLDT